jgi:hypothetical protein
MTEGSYVAPIVSVADCLGTVTMVMLEYGGDDRWVGKMEKRRYPN